MVAGHLISSALTTLIVDYLKEQWETERKYMLPIMEDAQAETINRRQGFVFDWHKWAEIGLGQKQAYGTDLTSGKTFSLTTSKGQLRLIADFIDFDPFGESVRVDSVVEAAGRHFRKQIKRTQWEWMRGGIQIGSGYYGTAAGFDATGSESWTTPTKVHAGGQGADRTGLINLGYPAGGIKAAALHDLAFILGMNGAPTFDDGTYHLALSRFGIKGLLKDDTEFRDLFEGGDLTVFKENELPRWASFSIRVNDMPYRESSGAAVSDSTHYNFSSTGDLIYDYAYGPGFMGVVKLGAGGQNPTWKTQDISKVANSEVTMSYSLINAAGVIDATWGIPFGYLVSPTDSAASSL